MEVGDRELEDPLLQQMHPEAQERRAGDVEAPGLLGLGVRVDRGLLGFRRGESVCVARFGDGPEPDLAAYGDVLLAGGATGGSMTWWLR